ncbi:unnamed protein product [Prorocentrum cordatum]|uniref:Dynein heavy chain AAA module D4 domain-containing protein n=1 Tax=Prorocentrum cordatum TaxID=2364126 RepID=A0ABN9RT02_9DINO|nr:unnamed protein product [Polarella glacialis]
MDSAFSSFPAVADELIGSGAIPIPAFVLRLAFRVIHSEVRERAGFDMYDLQPVERAPGAVAPALFATAEDDTLVPPHHSRALHDAWGGDCELVTFGGGHDGQRPHWFLEHAAAFLEEHLAEGPAVGGARPEKATRRGPAQAARARGPSSEVSQAAPPGGGGGGAGGATAGLAAELAAMGFEPDLVSEAAKRHSSVPAAVDWILELSTEAARALSGARFELRPPATLRGVGADPEAAGPSPRPGGPGARPAAGEGAAAERLERELQDMGYTPEQAKQAARRCSSLPAAVDWLSAGSDLTVFQKFPDASDWFAVAVVYEPALSWDHVKKKAYYYLKRFNEAYPARAMQLVLFDDAMKHLMKINRTIQQKRGSAMLVGVGGSGKQSLARLASFISGHHSFQITVTKFYNDLALFEDLRLLYQKGGVKGESVTFLFTDAEVKSESFLEYMNSLLATGEARARRDERDAMCGEVRNDFVKDNPHMEETLLNMYPYFMGRLRDNLHVCLCFSPVSQKFAIRAQKFPAVFSVNINWFMPWPEDALVAVSNSFLSSFKVDCTEEDRRLLYQLTGAFQAQVRGMCDTYYSRMRKHVYVTPKSFLCLIDFYKVLYASKYDEVNQQERSVNVGLQKLREASEYVEKLKVTLKEQEVTLKTEEGKTTELLLKVQGEKAKADKKAEVVNGQKADCKAEAEKIDAEKQAAQQGLTVIPDTKHLCKRPFCFNATPRPARALGAKRRAMAAKKRKALRGSAEDRDSERCRAVCLAAAHAECPDGFGRFLLGRSGDEQGCRARPPPFPPGTGAHGQT